MVDFLHRQGFADEDIVIIMDEPCEGIPPDTNFLRMKRIRSTHRSILKQCHKLAKESQSGDRLFLLLSGHAMQQPAISDPYEKDRMDEFYLPSNYHRHTFTDEKGQLQLRRKGKILDNTLRQELVDRLPEGVELFTLIDCCSGGTLMDLPYEAEREKAAEKSSSCAAKALGMQVKNAFTSPLRCSTLPLSSVREGPVESPRRRAYSFYNPGGLPASGPALLPKFRPVSQSDQPLGRLMPQPPRQDRRHIRGHVVSISSCPDGDVSYDTPDGGLLVSTFIRVMTEEPDLTYIQLHDKIKSRLRAYHEDIIERFKKRGEPWDEKCRAPVPQFTFSHDYKWDERFSHFCPRS